MRVSSSLKLRNASNFHILEEEEEEDDDDDGRRAIKEMDEHKQLQILKIASLTENPPKKA